jgi:hypothetical protein
MTTPQSDLEETESAAEQQPPIVAPMLRYLVATILTMVALAGAAGIARYAWHHPDTEPSALRLHEVVLVAVVLAGFVVFPWQRTGWRITKVGWVEFERIVSTQKKEQVDSFELLAKRVDRLEREVPDPSQLSAGAAKSAKAANPAVPGMGVENEELRNILLTFLRAHPALYFNGPRIRRWGGEQAGFESLKQYPIVIIKQELQRLLAQDLVRHRVSKRSGNTLFRARS